MLPTDEKQKNTISSISVMRSPEKVYKIYSNFKDLEFNMPIGWNDKYLAIFVQSCRMYLDDLKKTELDDKGKWHKIVLFCAKLSENNSLFTINNCIKMAQSIKKYVLSNLNRMVNNEVFHAFYCDIKDLLEYFPSESNIILTRSTSDVKASSYLNESSELGTSVEDAIYGFINKNVAAIKNNECQFWEDSSKNMNDRFGISCNIKDFLRLKKEQVINEVNKFNKMSQRKRKFNEIAKKLLPIFDFIEPTSVQKRDFLNSYDEKPLINEDSHLSSKKQEKYNVINNIKHQMPNEKSNLFGQKALRTERKRSKTTMKKQSIGSVVNSLVECNQNKPDDLNNAVIKSEIGNPEISSAQESGLQMDLYSSMPSTSQQIEKYDLKKNISSEESNEIYSNHTGDNDGMESKSEVQFHKKKKNTAHVCEVANFCKDIYGGHLEESKNETVSYNLGQDDKAQSFPTEPLIENSLSYIQDGIAQNYIQQEINNCPIVQNKANCDNSGPFPSLRSPIKNSYMNEQFSDDKSQPFKKGDRSATTNDVFYNSGLKFGTSDQQVLLKVESNQISVSSYNTTSQKPNVMTSTFNNTNDHPVISTLKESKKANLVKKCTNFSEVGNNSRSVDDKENPHSSPYHIPLKRKRGRPRKDMAGKHTKIELSSPTEKLKLLKKDNNTHLSRPGKSYDIKQPLKKRGRYTCQEQILKIKANIENQGKSPKSRFSQEVISGSDEKDKTLKKEKDLLHIDEFNQNESSNSGFLMSLRKREACSVHQRPKVKKVLRREKIKNKEVFKAEYCVNLEKSSIINLNPVVKLIDFMKNPSAILKSQVKVTEHTHNNENIKITDEEMVTITLSTVDSESSSKNKYIPKPITQDDHSKTIASKSHRRKGKSVCPKTNHKTIKSQNMKNKTKMGKMKLRKKTDSLDRDWAEIDANTKKSNILCKSDVTPNTNCNTSRNNSISVNCKISTLPSLDMKSLNPNTVNTDNAFNEESSTSVSISKFQQLNLNDYAFDGNEHELSIDNILSNVPIKSLTELKEISALQANSPERARLVELITCSFEISHSMEKYDYNKPGWFGDYSKDFMNWEICKVQGLVSKFEDQLKERNELVEELEKIVENVDIKNKSLSK